MVNRIADEISVCLEHECFIAALSLALTLPDICGKAEFPCDSVTKRYIQWYNEHIGQYEIPNLKGADDMPYPSGEVVYNLRNSMLHQGTPNVDAKQIKQESCKVDHFTLLIADVSDGGGSSVSVKGNGDYTNRSLSVNAVNLCFKLCSVAKNYYNENKEKFDFFEYDIDERREKDTDIWKPKSEDEIKELLNQVVDSLEVE